LRLILEPVELRSICFNTEGKSIYWFFFRVISFPSALGVGIETPAPRFLSFEAFSSGNKSRFSEELFADPTIVAYIT